MRHSPLLATIVGTIVAVLAALAAAPPVAAVVPPAGDEPPASLAFRDPDLYIRSVYRPPAQLAPDLAIQAQTDLGVLGVGSDQAFFDRRTGRWGTLILRRPLIPGAGAGNAVAWSDLGLAPPATEADLGRAAWQALVGYLTLYQPQLRVAPGQLDPEPSIAVHEGGRIVQIAARQVVAGVPVRDSYLTATLNGGNLVLLGTRNWSDVTAAAVPSITAEAALAAVAAHAAGSTLEGLWAPTELVFVPLENGDDPDAATPGLGIRHRLAWAVSPAIAGDDGSWQGLVDAQDGALLAFQDQNQYAAVRRQVQGGVYPVSNDQQAPDGVEQAGYPMPFADVALPGGGLAFTNSAGLLGCVDGTIRTALAGPYVKMNDNCGAVNEATGAAVLDLGAGPGTDCAVPAGHSAGDTHSSRSGFYELNRLVEMAKGWIPGNEWLYAQLTANMNINATCNAFWNGSTVNFYRSGGGCRNTGEIAAIFDHEWGHGLDANDNTPTVSSPGESIADTYAMLRLQTSCIGRGFRANNANCGGYGDPCTGCSGVRDIDFANHVSGQPHDIDWVNNPPVLPGGGCLGYVSGGVGPCGQETHCEGMVPAEAAWDLVARDLPAAPFNFDANTSFEIGSRLYFIGAGNVLNWYQCTPVASGLGGCNADGGYLNLLAVDDDNGDLTDGTPHMEAIYRAYNRHQIACVAPAVVNSGCAGGPTAAPDLTVAPLADGARLAWDAVAGAQRYWIFRTEGVNGCNFGKVRIAETTGTSYDDLGLRAGFPYSYGVMAVGDNDSCFTAMSDCATVTPASGANVGVAAHSAELVEIAGDGDAFLDNCEKAEVRFRVENTGTGTLTNVRIVDVESLSHPATQVQTAFPAAVAASLAECGAATGSFTVRADGLAYDDTVRFRVDLTSDELDPEVRSAIVELAAAESDFDLQASKSFNFDAFGDLEGWQVERGTYTQAPGGPVGSTAYLASSAGQDNICDQMRSPLVRLTPTSTLSLQTNFTIEPPLAAFGDVYYDRANVGIVDAATGVRTTISPDGGRTYNASGPNGACVTTGQPGWADAMPTWEPSTWSPGALQTAGFAGKNVRLDVAYGTDPSLSLGGFWFDEVTLTDVETQEPDSGSDVCAGIVANDDSATTAAGSPVTIDVLANDVTSSPPLSVVAVGTPAHGGAVDNGDGTVTYTPNPGFSGTDSFTYTAEDAASEQDSATVTVTVTGDPHCAAPGVEVVSDPLGDTNAAVDATDDPSLDLESVSLAEPYFGPGQQKLVVTIKVEDFSSPHPSAAWRAYWTSPGGTQQYFVAVENCDATTGLQCSYGTFDGTLFSSAGTPEGCVTAADGTLTLTVDKSLVGIDDSTDEGELLLNLNGRTQVFIGALCTGLLGQADTAGPGDYEIATNASCQPNDPPVADDQAVATAEDTAVAITLTASDADGDPLTYGVVAGPAHGSLSGTAPNLTYTPQPNYNGPDAFTFKANDGQADSNVATVSITVAPVNDAPVAVDDAASTDEGVALDVAVLANDSDPDGDALTVAAVADPPNGTATINPDDTIHYAPDPGFFGLDGFSYTVCDRPAGDPEQLCASATVRVTVREGNEAPVAADDAASTPMDTPVTIDVLANDSDPDGDPLTVTDVSAPANGSTVNHGDGTVTYTPNAGFTGTDTFTYTVCDDGSLCDTATVTVVVTEPGGTAGQVHGSGWLYTTDPGDPHGKLHFSFDARPDGAGGFTGKLQVNDKEVGVKVDARQILTLGAGSGDCHGAAPGANTFEFTAVGKFNGLAGATFRVCGADVANPGKDGDRVFVECLAGCGYSTGARTPDDVIDGGNVHLHGAAGASSLTARSATAAAPVQVLDLDPVLLTSAPVGSDQLLVAIAHDGAVGGRSITLTWRESDGSTGSATAVTDALGVALFVATVGSGETEYTAATGGLESNGVAVTGTALGLP